jgi:hypothetical protein
VAAVVVSAMAAFVGSGSAAGQAKPVNTTPPTISGTPQEGQTLHATRGEWNNNPTDYNFFWRRCNSTGGSCSNISGAGGSRDYKLGSADVGNTIRFRVDAKNGDGKTSATSVPTAVITKATAPPPANGCPSSGPPHQVSQITGPANLIVDQFIPTPSIITRSTQSWTFRVKVTSTCGGPVQGALVYGTATPFNQWAIPPEATTGSDGFATLTFERLTGFPVSNKQELIAMFLRARKPGDNVLAGITGFRLVSVPVDLNR